MVQFVVDLEKMEKEALLREMAEKVKSGEYEWRYTSDPKGYKMTVRLVKTNGRKKQDQ